MSSAPKPKREFKDFSDLATYLKHQLGGELQAVESARIKPLTSTPQVEHQMREKIHLAGVLFSEKDYVHSDDQAKHVLALAGITSKEQITGAKPDELTQKIPEEQRVYVSLALSMLGTSYHLMRRHIDSVDFLERAVALDPDNIYAARNLTDLCVAASPRALTKESPNFAEELNRETTVGIKVAQQTLEKLGITPDHLSGQKTPDPNELSDNAKNITWILNNLATLLYRRGRYLIHTTNQPIEGSQHLRQTRDATKTTLTMLKQPTDPIQILEAETPELGAESMTASRALSIMGSTYELIKDTGRAYFCYQASLKITPDFREAKDKLDRVWAGGKSAAEKIMQAKRQPKKQQRPERQQTPPEQISWEQICAELQTASPKLRTPEIELTHCDMDVVMGQASGIAQDLETLKEASRRHGPEAAKSLIRHLEAGQDKFWAQTDETTIPELIRAEATLEAIAAKPQLFGLKSPSPAEKTREQYLQIRQTMVEPHLEHDAGEITRLYREITAEKTT